MKQKLIIREGTCTHQHVSMQELNMASAWCSCLEETPVEVRDIAEAFVTPVAE